MDAKTLSRLGLLVAVMLVLGTASVGAYSGTFDFDTPWSGNNDVSVTIPIDSTAFDSLSFYQRVGDSYLYPAPVFDDPIHRSDYVVAGTKDETHITLNSEFLKMHNLENGRYMFWAEYYKEGLYTEVFDLELVELSLEETVTAAELPLAVPGSSLTRLVKITNHGVTVDSLNYEVIRPFPTSERIYVVFDNEFLNSLNEEPFFQAHLAGDYASVLLGLTVDLSDSLPDTSDALGLAIPFIALTASGMLLLPPTLTKRRLR